MPIKLLIYIVFALGAWLNLAPQELYAQIQIGTPNPLTGRTGAAGPASIDAATINPAQAGLMSFSELQLSLNYLSTSSQLRYPGNDAVHTTKAGLNPAAPLPSGVFKITPWLGLSVFAVPFEFKVDINKSNIPMLILNQQQSVDMVGDGALEHLYNVMLGIAPSKSYAFGINFIHTALRGDVALVPSIGGDPIATVSLHTNKTDVRLGTKFRLVPGLYLGAVVGAFTSTQTHMSIQSSLISSNDPAAAAQNQNGGDTTSTTSLNPIRIGMAVQPSNILVISTDFEYQRADKSQRRYSIVDLKEKPLDTADTLSFYMGSEARLWDTGVLLLGALYEPSAIGPGKKRLDTGTTSTDEGQTGFGFLDLAQGLGEVPDKPQWMLGGGVRWFFGKIVTKVGKKKRTDPRMMLEGGLVYGETSIGVDETGEQPGAYLVRRTQIPIKFNYRF